MPRSEFLDEMWREAKAQLPGWLYASLVQSARPRAGGRAAHRVDEPTLFEKIALEEIRPDKLRAVTDDELGELWTRLSQWHKNATKRKRPTETLVNAALWTRKETERRGRKVNREAPLVEATLELEQIAKSETLFPLGDEIPNSGQWLPGYVQKKTDGVEVEIHKDGSQVLIYDRRTGENYSPRLPEIAEEIRKMSPPVIMFEGDLEGWINKTRFPPGRVREYLASSDDDIFLHITANLTDVLFSSAVPAIRFRKFDERLSVLKSMGGGTSGPPGRRAVNVIPGVRVETDADLREAIDLAKKAPGSVGAVLKALDAPLSAVGIADDGVILNKTDVRAVIMKRIDGEMPTYLAGIMKGADSEELLPVSVFSSVDDYSPGDRVLIPATCVRKEISDSGTRIEVHGVGNEGAYIEAPDTVTTLSRRAYRNRVLEVVDVSGPLFKYFEPRTGDEELVPEVPTMGPARAEVIFVGACPSGIEKARRELLVGPVGETFRDLYLEPLGKARDEVLISTVVPVVLTDVQGRGRQPTEVEVSEWREWIHKELDSRAPGALVVALGRVAGEALGDRADYILPHPTAVRKHGDSGEVGRKVRQIKERLGEPVKKATRGEEGGTMSIRSAENWNKNWYRSIPKSGKGRFVYQHHWRGLDEGETKQSDEQLLGTDHSLHGDLRLEGNDGALWGFSIFLGTAADNKAQGGDKLLHPKDDQRIEATPKLAQSKEWLDVGVGSPTVTEPGEVGATSDKYSKFFALESGTYRVGVVREHSVEIFLDSGSLQGRYLVLFVPIAGRRRWLINKPTDQAPIADGTDLADLTSELKQKGQRFLVWTKPGQRPQLIDVKSGRVVKNDPVSIRKADPVKRIVYGVVLDPYGSDGPQEDAHNDWNPPSEIEQSAHDYLKGSRVVGIQHKKRARAEVVESWVEQYPSRADYLKALRGEAHRVYRRKFGDDVIHSGSWILGVQLDEDTWRDYEAGELNAFSPGGFGVRKPISRSDMPRVSFVNLEEKEQA